ncbi:MAG TPA: DUF1641 domain-containing protein [Burkholderiaceae bacterium]|nr:DUF1641 domain-containing protein [Burkholderiaceae bacterium]
MAKPIDYEVKPTPTDPTAREELDTLLQSLHERGVLRFANDVVCAQEDIAGIVVNGLSKQGTLNAIQNLSILGMALSRIPPEDFYKFVFGFKDAMSVLNTQAQSERRDDAPGVTGAYRMLKDEQLWQSISPLLEALKAFSSRMSEEPEKPVTRFTGKPTEM